MFWPRSVSQFRIKCVFSFQQRGPQQRLFQPELHLNTTRPQIVYSTHHLPNNVVQNQRAWNPLYQPAIPVGPSFYSNNCNTAPNLMPIVPYLWYEHVDQSYIDDPYFQFYSSMFQPHDVYNRAWYRLASAVSLTSLTTAPNSAEIYYADDGREPWELNNIQI